jgi:Tol biopolymer transport system component/Zn-dependent M28 family amino/carboxypeptidase
MPRNRATSLLALLSLSIVAAAGPPAATSRLTSRFEKDVRVLASDEMEGRGLGTPGIARAADWIERRLKELHLEPAFEGSYRQPFPVKTGVRKVVGNELSGASPDEWTPLASSSSGAFDGELAFVGYGIEAPPLSYQELSTVNVRGKVALMLRYEPQEKDDTSRFDGRRPSRWSAIRYKVHRARELGAVAVVFVTGPLQEPEQDRLPVLANDGPESAAGIPVIQVKRAHASKWLGRAGIDLLEFQKAVDADLKPRSVASVGVRVSGRVALDATQAQTANVAAKLQGRGSLANDVVVIGAHYDHLGYGGNGSMKPNERAIHNGADDNASGTAAVLAAAERLKELVKDARNRRTVYFVLFSGEESGIAGSSFFVAHPPVPLDRVRAMVNLDMVGDLRDDQLIAFGAESAPEWNAALESSAKPLGLKLTSKGDGYGPSDQTSFYTAKIPVLHFFTGAHERYHTPGDDAGSVNFAGGARVAEMTARLGEQLALGKLSPTYAVASAAPAMQGDSRGYGAYLGTIPDYRAMEDAKGGVLLGDVRPGGPAARAGIRGGDRIVEMAGTKIENLYDMTFALQDHRPGETIDVVVVRDGSRVTLRATLGERRGSEPGAAPAHATPPASSEIKAGKPFGERFDGERHLQDVRQLTFGGENAEAYFSPDGTRLIYQSTPPGASCDQQFVMDLVTGETKRVSSGKGRTTCGYFRFPQGDRIVYASTEATAAECPPPPDRSKGYVWAVYDGYDLYEAMPDGSQARRLTQTPGYDAEATWCPKGGKLVFTSERDGDLDLYEMSESGAVKRLTSAPGYDGGAFYNPDCSEIVWRASRPTGAALSEFRDLLANGLVRPTALELFLAKADGSGPRQLTSNGAANFCPYFHPDGKRIVYSSNAGSPDGREFDLWLIAKTGGAAERLTAAPGFDGFPQFSPDGKRLVWGSNRANPKGHETNLFLARWMD